MKKFLNLIIIALIAFSCGSNGNLKKSKGELVGVKGNKYFAEKPFGMVLVPGGSFIMGKSDDDMPSIQDAQPKQLLFDHSTWMKLKLQMLSTDNLLDG